MKSLNFLCKIGNFAKTASFFCLICMMMSENIFLLIQINKKCLRFLFSWIKSVKSKQNIGSYTLAVITYQTQAEQHLLLSQAGKHLKLFWGDKTTGVVMTWKRCREQKPINTPTAVIMSRGYGCGYPQGCVHSSQTDVNHQLLLVIAPFKSPMMLQVMYNSLTLWNGLLTRHIKVCETHEEFDVFSAVFINRHILQECA